MSARPSNSDSPTRSVFPWWRWLGLIGVWVVVVLLLVAWQVNSTYRTFLAQSGLSDRQLRAIWREAQLTQVENTDGQTVVLVLGVDSLSTRGESLPLTDTIILANLDPGENRISLLSLPRDTVLPGYTNRINAIYPVFYQQATESARERTAEVLSEQLDIPIHYSIVVTMDAVREFLDLIGGVDVTVQNSFTDYQFPREDVDVTAVHDPALLYETVSFEAGPAHLDGTMALKFMRSRHAQNAEGSDFARSARQQQVIEAAATKVGATLREQLASYDLTLVGQLYRFYDEKFSVQLPFVDGLALGLRFLQDGLPQVESGALSVGTAGAVLQENPRDYTLQVTSLAQLRREVREKLHFD